MLHAAVPCPLVRPWPMPQTQLAVVEDWGLTRRRSSRGTFCQSRGRSSSGRMRPACSPASPVAA